MTVEVILTIAAPIVVFLATMFVQRVVWKFSGAVVVSIVVPFLSLGAAWVVTLIKPESVFWIQLVVNVSATWLNEVIKQIREQLKPKEYHPEDKS